MVNKFQINFDTSDNIESMINCIQISFILNCDQNRTGVTKKCDEGLTRRTWKILFLIPYKIIQQLNFHTRDNLNK